MNNEEFRILIVEDNDIYRELLRNILQRTFPTLAIYEAANGREALHKVDAFLPDLIFMDIHLGGESGLELTRQIKAMHPNMHVVILTFYDMPEYRKAALQFGTDGFLVKASLTAAEIERLVKSYQTNARSRALK